MPPTSTPCLKGPRLNPAHPCVQVITPLDVKAIVRDGSVHYDWQAHGRKGRISSQVWIRLGDFGRHGHKCGFWSDDEDVNRKRIIEYGLKTPTSRYSEGRHAGKRSRWKGSRKLTGRVWIHFKETIKEHKLQWKSVMEVERDQNETQGQKGALARIKHGITVTRNG